MLKDKISIISSINKQFGLRFAFKYGYYLKTDRFQDYIKLVEDYLIDFYKQELCFFENTLLENNIDAKPVKYVFVCWWQGYKDMPDLCKACYNRLRHVLSSDYELVFITKDNYYEYVNLSDIIVDKMNDGLIPIIQFSDILRQSLIAQNGGIWIDSTVWTNEGINDYIGNIKDFWSIKLEEVYNPYVIGQLISSCRWSGFIIGGRKESPFFNFSSHCICKYFETHDILIDYFLQNFIFKIIFDHTSYGSEIISNLAPSNPHLYDLQSMFNQKFSDSIFEEFNHDTSFFKLTYKATYDMFCNGYPTYFKYIMDTIK